MSDLFMDMHRCRRRWHSHQTTPPTSTSATTTTSESPSSTQHTNDHIFSHHNYSTTNDADAASNANYNYNNRKEGKEEKHHNNNDDIDVDDNDEFANILSLKLRKPKHWKWELSTSKSCSNIALPRILLYDHKGQLLVDAQGNGDESVYKQTDSEKPKRDKSKKRSHQSKQDQSWYQQRSATTNLTHSIRKALEKEFNGLQIQEATPSPEPYSQISNNSHRSRKPIEFNTTDLPDYGLSSRSSSLRGVRFNVEDDDEQAYYESQIPECLPTPPSTTTPTSSSSGPREKRKYRRSQSSGRSSAHSGSILERFSYQKGRFSSPEYAEEKVVKHGTRYFLRTSKAGTLIVQEDSFSQHPRRRRRPLKNRSTESLQSMQKSSLSSNPPAQQQSANNSPTPGELSRNRKQQPIRRHLTDENILLNKQFSTSEEDVAVAAGQKQLMDNVNSRHLRKYVDARNQAKASLEYSTDVHQNGKVR